MSTAEERLDELAGAIADGKIPDWKEIEREGLLSESQLRALQALQEMSALSDDHSRDSRDLEQGYEILEQLGEGASATVYRARDKALDAEVALKIIRSAGQLLPERRRQFIEEARTLAALRHPNILRILAIDESAGRIRMVLELVRGSTLQDLIEESGPMAATEAAQIGVELCRALAAIHEQGLIHLDLKPDNVMREKGGRIVLLDFGVARREAPDQAKEPRQINGTPLFMAPEQYNPGAALTPQTDLYALGVVLYWLTTARLPIEASTIPDLQKKVLAGEWVPLLDRRSDLPSEFVQIVHRALSRDPAARFSSAGAMAQELEGILARRNAPAPTRMRTWVGVSLTLAILAVGLKQWSPWADSETAPQQAASSSRIDFEARLVVEREGNLVPLEWGSRIEDGDHLALEFVSDKPVYVYVFNQDDLGSTSVAFPLDGFDLKNPLAAGKRHLLPGTVDGVQQSWVMGGAQPGSENFVWVVSSEPDPLAESLQNELQIPKQFDQLTPATQNQLRGIQGTAKIEASNTIGLTGGSTSLARIAASRRGSGHQSGSVWTLVQLARK